MKLELICYITVNPLLGPFLNKKESTGISWANMKTKNRTIFLL